MLAVPAVDGRNVEVQVAVPAVALAANVHVVNVPVTPVTANVTVPVGVMTVPTAELSPTVATQLDPWLTNTGVEQVTDVVVDRVLTVTLAAALVLPL